MRKAIPVLAGFAMVAIALHDAGAWVRAGRYGEASGGGGSWSAHSWRGGSASGSAGSWSGTGYRGGTASGGGGSWSAHGANGGSAYGSDGYWHGTGAYGGSYYGGYHPPTTVNYYGSGCYNCGGWGGGAAATSLLAGAALGAAAANANNTANSANAYAAGVTAGQASTLGAIYGQLPAGCTFTDVQGANYYHCGAMWLEPAFGANGVYYRSVAAP